MPEDRILMGILLLWRTQGRPIGSLRPLVRPDPPSACARAVDPPERSAPRPTGTIRASSAKKAVSTTAYRYR